MILADKIMNERKRCGLSQEELAEKLGVSRQSVSKWEGAQSTPDLQRILQMAELFDVTTDYLLIDEKEKEELISTITYNDTEPPAHKISMEQANEYLTIGKSNAKKISLGVLLCILAGGMLASFGAYFSSELFPFSKNTFSIIITIFSFLLVALAVVQFILVTFQNKPYEFLEKEPIDLAYGVDSLIKEKKSAYASTYLRSLITGISACILSIIPFISLGLISEYSYAFYLLFGFAFLIIGFGVYSIVQCVTIQNCFDRLLQEGDYTLEEKRSRSIVEKIGGIYWLVITALYLAISFITGNWGRSWIVWPVAGVLFGAIAIIANMISDKNQK